MTGPAVTVEMRRNEHIWEVITGISVIYERLARGDEGERGPGRAVVCVTIGTQRGGFVHRGMWVWTSGDEVPRALLWKHQVGSWRQRSCTSLQVCAFCMHCVCIVYVLCVVCVLFYVSMSDACLCIVCIFCTFYVLCMFYLCALCFMCVYVLCVLMSMYCVRIGKLKNGTGWWVQIQTNTSTITCFMTRVGEKKFFLINWYWVNCIFILTPTLQHKNQSGWFAELNVTGKTIKL